MCAQTHKHPVCECTSIFPGMAVLRGDSPPEVSQQGLSKAQRSGSPAAERHAPLGIIPTNMLRRRKVVVVKVGFHLTLIKFSLGKKQSGVLEATHP